MDQPLSYRTPWETLLHVKKQLLEDNIYRLVLTEIEYSKGGLKNILKVLYKDTPKIIVACKYTPTAERLSGKAVLCFFYTRSKTRKRDIFRPLAE